jgi:TM2 domain-containing membrane protein YozV
MHLHPGLKGEDMKTDVKAALLSAFVLPGIGQIYKGAKIKGGVIIVLVNVFLLTALFLVMKGLGALLVTARISGREAAEKVLDSLTERGPAVRVLLAAFFVLWVYSVMDALLKDEGNGNNR